MATPIPPNGAPFTLAEILSATSGTARGVAPDTAVKGVTTDSRTEMQGKLFVALSGEHFDGHKFAADAVGRGASVVLARRGVLVDSSLPLVEVDDTLVALGKLARHHRKQWGGPVIAVAGSAGKTTTRSAISTALEAVAPGAVHSVPGNLNNRIGVPMVLFGLTDAHAVSVVEIGTNLPGEVAELTAIANPNIGVLTLIDVEHTEGLGSLDAIEAEEGALLRGLPRTGTAIANADDERAARQLVQSPPRRKVSYGTRGAADYRLVRRENIGVGGTRVFLERPRGRGRETITLDVPLLGLPGALSIAAAVAAADRISGRPVPAERLLRAFNAGGLGEPGRLRPIVLADRTVVLDDSYNANPASVRAAIATAREIADDRAARLVLILGEMRELGSESAALHDEIAFDVGASGAAALIAVAGEAERFVAPALSSGVDATFLPDSTRAAAAALDRVRPGDVVLVKASRGVHAERVVEELVRARGRAA